MWMMHLHVYRKSVLIRIPYSISEFDFFTRDVKNEVPDHLAFKTG